MRTSQLKSSGIVVLAMAMCFGRADAVTAGSASPTDSPPADSMTVNYNTVMATKDSQAYLIYGSFVQANATAAQTIGDIAAYMNSSSSTGNTTYNSGSVSSGGIGVNDGGAIIQFNNSATAYAIGGG